MRQFILWLVFGGIAFGCNAQNDIVSLGDKDSYHLHSGMEILWDEDGTLSLDEVAGQAVFQPYAELKDFQLDAEVIWLRFRIGNHTTKEEQYFLNTVYFDSVEVYELKGNRLALQGKSGFLIPVDRRNIEVFRTSLAPINVASESNSTFYVRIHSGSKFSKSFSRLSFSVGFDLFTFQGVQNTFFNLRDHTFLLAGVLLMMFFFNLLLAYKAREKVYYWLAAYNLISCLNYLNAYGYTLSSGLLESKAIMQMLQFNLPVLLMFTYGWFTLYFLELKAYFPRVSRIIVALNCLLVVVPVLYSLGYINMALGLVICLTVPGLGLVLFSLFRKYREKQNLDSVNFYVAGSCLISVFFINYLFGIIWEESNHFWNEILLLCAAIGELMIFTYAAVQKFVKAQRAVVSMKKNEFNLLEEQEEIKEELAEKNKALVTKTSQELSRYQKQKEALTLLQKIVLPIDSEFNSDLHNAIQKIKKLSIDKSFEEEFLVHFNGVHIGFSDRLHTRHPNLSINNIRLCAYLRMNLTSLEIAQLQGVEKSSVNQARYRLRKKMNLGNDLDLVAYLASV